MNALRVPWFATGLAVLVIGLAGCGGDDDDDGGGGATTAPAAEGDRQAGGGEKVLIKTRLEFENDVGAGTVVKGSRIGDSEFCPGGKFRDRRGVPPEGTVVKEFSCADGDLSITFTPGPPKPTEDSEVQTGVWSVVSGTGSFEGLELRGEGQVKAEFTKADPDKGTETFTGTTGP